MKWEINYCQLLWSLIDITLPWKNIHRRNGYLVIIILFPFLLKTSTFDVISIMCNSLWKLPHLALLWNIFHWKLNSSTIWWMLGELKNGVSLCVISAACLFRAWAKIRTKEMMSRTHFGSMTLTLTNGNHQITSVLDCLCLVYTLIPKFFTAILGDLIWWPYIHQVMHIPQWEHWQPVLA